MMDKLDFLIENKKEIDTAFLEMMANIKHMLTDPKEDNTTWFDLVISEYEKIKCKNCCEPKQKPCLWFCEKPHKPQA